MLVVSEREVALLHDCCNVLVSLEVWSIQYGLCCLTAQIGYVVMSEALPMLEGAGPITLGVVADGAWEATSRIKTEQDKTVRGCILMVYTCRRRVTKEPIVRAKRF